MRQRRHARSQLIDEAGDRVKAKLYAKALAVMAALTALVAAGAASAKLT